MRVCVVGCGAVGSVIAVAAARGGAEVCCVHRGVGGVSRGRVVVDGLGFEEVLLSGWSGVKGWSFDAVFYAVKAYDVADAIKLTLNYGVRGDVYISLQNGLGSLEMLAQTYPGRAASGVVYFGALRLSRGRARLTGRGPLILGPAPSGGAPLAFIKRVAEVLSNGGLDVDVVGDIEPHRWLKLSVNAAINPVTVLAWAKNRVVVEDPDARALAEALAAEAGRVAEAFGVKLPRDPVEAVHEAARSTGENCSSMLQDAALKGVTEVDYINGAIVERAKAKGLEAPYNEAVWRAVRLLQRWLKGRRLPCET